MRHRKVPALSLHTIQRTALPPLSCSSSVQPLYLSLSQDGCLHETSLLLCIWRRVFRESKSSLFLCLFCEFHQGGFLQCKLCRHCVQALLSYKARFQELPFRFSGDRGYLLRKTAVLFWRLLQPSCK